MAHRGDLVETGNNGARVFNNPCFVFQPIPEDRYKMQSKPLGICLILDCIGNDTGRCGCCRVNRCLQSETTAQAGYTRRPGEHSRLSQTTAHLCMKGSFPFRSQSSVDWAKAANFQVVRCKDVYNMPYLTVYSQGH